MNMRAPIVPVQRDNLNIGIYLAGRAGGAQLDDVLQAALGYNPNGPYPTNSREEYERRFRKAQSVGRDRFRNRTAGYFTFNAMPFGHIYVYKITWYVWINPQTNEPQTVPMETLDLARMRQTRERDFNTREGTLRSITAAHDIEEERKAIARQDYHALQAIQSRMIDDGSLGEIISGWHGLEYADIQEIIPQLPTSSSINVTFQFQRTAQKINRLNAQLRQERSHLSQQLLGWVMLQTGLPSNAPQLALQDAIARVTSP